MDMKERLEIEAECARLINQFVWCIDEANPDEAASLFTPDGVYEHASGTSWEGHDGIRALLADRSAHDGKAAHIVSNVLVDVVDGDNAAARMFTQLFFHQGPFDPDAAPPLNPMTIFPSSVRFKRTDAGWKASRWCSLDDFRES